MLQTEKVSQLVQQRLAKIGIKSVVDRNIALDSLSWLWLLPTETSFARLRSGLSLPANDVDAVKRSRGDEGWFVSRSTVVNELDIAYR